MVCSQIPGRAPPGTGTREEMASVGEETLGTCADAGWPGTRSLSAGLRDSCPPGRRPPKKISPLEFQVPPLPPARRRGLHRPARTVDLFQLGIGKEPDEPAVRRPEGIVGAVGAGRAEWLRGIERADPDLLLSVFDENHRDLAAVR